TTVGLDPEDTAWRTEYKMAVKLGCCVGSKHYPVLLGQMSYAQGLGEASGAGRVELHISDAALDNKIAHREAGQLALAVSDRDRRRRGQPGEISGLQVPMQRLLEPENPVRFDGTGEVDAVRQVEGRVSYRASAKVHRRGVVAGRRPSPLLPGGCRHRSGVWRGGRRAREIALALGHIRGWLGGADNNRR